MVRYPCHVCTYCIIKLPCTTWSCMCSIVTVLSVPCVPLLMRDEDATWTNMAWPHQLGERWMGLGVWVTEINAQQHVRTATEVCCKFNYCKTTHASMAVLTKHGFSICTCKVCVDSTRKYWSNASAWCSDTNSSTDLLCEIERRNWIYSYIVYIYSVSMYTYIYSLFITMGYNTFEFIINMLVYSQCSPWHCLVTISSWLNLKL